MLKRIKSTYFKKVGYLLLLTLLASCSTEEGLLENDKAESESVMNAYITGRQDYNTRRVTDSDDGWSTNSFTYGDVAGFFSTKGNLSSEYDESAKYPEGVINGQMSYLGNMGSAYKFGNSEIRLDPSAVASGVKYMYFPYSPALDNALDDDATEGMKIRVEDNGIEKCVDYMYTSSFDFTNGVLSPKFSHLFSEIVVIPGEGFDQQEEQEIKIVLASPWTDIKIRENRYTSGAIYSWVANLYYNGDNSDEAKLKARTWETWPGKDYKNRKAWYAVLPTTNTGTTSFNQHRISYIEIKDNYGHVQKVSDFYFGTSDGEEVKTIYGGRRYPVEVVLTEIGAIVRPVVIEPWEDPTEITDKREKGINDFAEFEQWASHYNTYLASGRLEDEEGINTLLQYGDAVRDINGRMNWTFYVNNDIVFEDNTLFQIDRLEDVLIGASNYVNFTLSKLNKPLVKVMDDHGALMNLDFKDLYVASSSTDPVGGIFTTIKGGRVENCNILLGIVVGAGPVGMIAGEVSDAVINYCSATGSIFGSTTCQEPFGLFGTTPESTILTDNQSGEILFELYNEN